MNVPHDLEIEAQALGAALLSPAASRLVVDQLTPSAFYSPAHRLVFGGVADLVERGQDVDPVIVASTLGSRGELDGAGGFAALCSLQANCGATSNVGTYVAMLRELDERRRLQAGMSEALAMVETAPLDAVRAAMERTLTASEQVAPEELLSLEAIDRLPDAAWLVEGMLEDQGLALIYGASGAGKTFVAVDLACSVAAGVEWMGKATKQGRVVYVLAEGKPRRFAQRLHTWKHAHDDADLNDLRVQVTAVDLRDANAVASLVRKIRSRLDEPPALVVIDTLARSLPGADENSAKDVGMAVDSMSRIGAEFGCLVLAVHHVGHGEQYRERGSSALRGAVDTSMSVTATNGVIVLACSKQKEAEEFDPISLTLEHVGPSVVVRRCVEGDPLAMRLQDSDRRAVTWVSRQGEPLGVGMKAIEVGTGLSESTVKRRMKVLVRTGLLEKHDHDGRPRYSVTDRGLVAIGETGVQQGVTDEVNPGERGITRVTTLRGDLGEPLGSPVDQDLGEAEGLIRKAFPGTEQISGPQPGSGQSGAATRTPTVAGDPARSFNTDKELT